MSSKSQVIKFTKNVGFKKAVEDAVDKFDKKISIKGGFQLYLKTGIIAVWFTISYLGLFIFSPPIWLLPGVVISFALATAAIGFNIQHDGAHGSYSKSKIVNKLAALSLGLIGGSHYLWAKKHNIAHHTYTNIEGHDGDFDIPFMRVSPEQKLRYYHRWQHIYCWGLYCFVSFLWVCVTDFTRFFSRRVSYKEIKPTRTDTLVFMVMKILYFAFIIVVPLLFHTFIYTLGVFLAFHAILGFTLAVVFQLAHIMPENEFPIAVEGVIENEWAVHQVKTTVNFAPGNKLLVWFVGGLNFQIEHHLFTTVSHVHYPVMAEVVKKNCTDFKIKYKSYPTFFAAIKAHYDFLKSLGNP